MPHDRQIETLSLTGWGISSPIDKASAADLIASGAAGNVFVIYDDRGGLYRFGNEMDLCTLTPHAADARQALPAEIIESGPLRVRARAPLQLAGQQFETIYSLTGGSLPADEHAAGGRGHHRSEPPGPIGSRRRRPADHGVRGAARALSSRGARARRQRRRRHVRRSPRAHHDINPTGEVEPLALLQHGGDTRAGRDAPPCALDLCR